MGLRLSSGKICGLGLQAWQSNIGNYISLLMSKMLQLLIFGMAFL
jgi:hypothetical protein